MYAKLILKSIIGFLILSSLFSCSKDSSNTTSPTPSSREVKYELTGTASGQFTRISAIYFSATGTAESENTIKLPWSKSITINNNVAAITFQATVSNASQGQTITAKLIVGGVVKLQQTATVGANGDVSIALPAYLF